MIPYYLVSICKNFIDQKKKKQKNKKQKKKQNKRSATLVQGKNTKGNAKR